MKILIFEYITGGGFNGQELPDSLANEGRLMLQALLDNLRSCAVRDGITVIVMLDSRVKGSINTAGMDTVIIKPEQSLHQEFTRLASFCDAVWPIAPEFDGILQTLCQAVETLGKRLLTSPASAVAVTSNKFNTYQHLKKHHIATVPTRMFTGADWDINSDALQLMQELAGLIPASPVSKDGQWLVKPDDGVGCKDSYILAGRQDFEQMRSRKGRYVIQPHIEGIKTSLSCLFKQGSGWLLCANFQQFDIIDQQYQLSRIIVNYDSEISVYQDLVNKIARALPELWGYAGIDLIETPEQQFVLEINPRLTTSFAGINEALGINVAGIILQLLEGNPTIKSVCNKSVIINVKQNESD